jgi:alpha-L-rhamnosidase
MKRFWDEETESYGPYGGNVFALSMGVDQERLEQVRKALRQVIEEADGHLDTGIFGTRLLFEILADHGMIDLAYQIINKRTQPSFGWWIEQGATTTWEAWNGVNSRNHPMFGGSLVWLQRILAGVRMNESSPAYEHIVVKPVIPEGLNQASYRIETVRGLVANSWKRNKDSFEMTTTIPAGSSAKVYLPASVASQWTENGQPLQDTELELPSGTYHFVGK